MKNHKKGMTGSITILLTIISIIGNIQGISVKSAYAAQQKVSGIIRNSYPEKDTEQRRNLYISASQIILPEPNRDNYDFIEWNTKNDGTGKSYGGGEIIEIQNIVLYAIWKDRAVAQTQKIMTEQKLEIKENFPIKHATPLNAELATPSNARINTESGIGKATPSDAEWQN